MAGFELASVSLGGSIQVLEQQHFGTRAQQSWLMESDAFLMRQMRIGEAGGIQPACVGGLSFACMGAASRPFQTRDASPTRTSFVLVSKTWSKTTRSG